ncbi:DUF2272 domain-containing protein [Rhizobium laguerreae]|uniref:DUF2272 domain-containing protein n=1 Tax=Rhizobium laguerreae TaxID=1076926 RepID=UPI001C914D45|nr:DUF2272 domain-containing protein [Rhizobium laguerreae]MBY3181024.1 DUF2272 domain-containing protein [Rhizobium laguerreae]
MPGPVVVRDMSPQEAEQLKIIFEGEGATVKLVPSDDGRLTLVATYPNQSSSSSNDGNESSTNGQGTGSAEQIGSAGADPAFVDRLIKCANDEWEFFGHQEYDLSNNPVRVGHKEMEEGFYQRIGRYWLEGTDTHGIDGRDTGSYWSATFISWLERTALAGDQFRYSIRHSVFISQSIRDRLSVRDGAGYWGYRLNERKPSVGDILCWGREAGVDYDHQKHGDYDGHSDVVVSVDLDKIWIVGGNVGNSVTKRPLPLGPNGYLAPMVVGGENLFAIMECRVGNGAAVISGESFLGNLSNGIGPGGDVGGAIPIAWGKVLDPALKGRVIQVAKTLGCDPSHLSSAMAFETGETFSPSIQNPNSKATGLIQFLPSTATSLGTSVDELASMSAVKQMDYVAKYFQPHAGKLRGLSDVYMAILWPAAVGDADSRAIFSRGTRAYTQNRGLDVNSDGVVTKGEAASKVQDILAKGLGTALIG